MRVIYILVGLIIVLAWLGWETRARHRGVSGVLFGFAGVLALMLAAAMAGLY